MILLLYYNLLTRVLIVTPPNVFKTVSNVNY